MCSATDLELQNVTSTTSILLSIAACKSTWSEPIPAVTAIFKFLALAILSFVK